MADTSRFFKLFGKILIQFSMANDKPRHWYSINQKSGHKEIRIVSLEKNINENGQTAYSFIFGPFHIIWGWI